MHPNYFDCVAGLGGVRPASVDTVGCDFRFYAVAPKTPTGSVDVLCKAGHEISITVQGLAGCVLRIPSQSGLESIEYDPVGPLELDVEAEVAGIAWEATAACKLADPSGENGEYREGEYNGVTVKLGSNPAKALFEGLTVF
ncbi:MAG TPA: hypothetical protein VGF95_03870 [Solirubrobacteraceae bacterium]|jgi:hypothetical protein